MDEHRTDVPVLPPGSNVELGGRGSTYVRQVEGPPGAPALLLLHGLAATADLNWFACFDELSQSFRVVAPDLRGHGGSVRAIKFDLEQCADDIAALIDALDVGPVIAVGYSMGGFVAQLLWRLHRRCVSGLVLCATAARVDGNRHWLTYQTLGAATTTLRFVPRALRPSADLIGERLFGTISDQALRSWARRQMRRNDLVTVFSAMEAVVRFSSKEWASAIDVPAAVLIPESDRVVPVERQRELADAIPAASVYTLEGDHGVCVTAPASFVPVLATACRNVADRAEGA
ncbi:MAG TPA: alpha/beta hydrolase [Acidimicrobiales bacterium]|nr:alpha/beta hydrolase [Acidimicrobiales bacterium]